MTTTPRHLAELLELPNASEFPEEPLLTGFAGLRDAGPHNISFLANPRYTRAARATKAGVVLAPESFSPQANSSTVVIGVESPSLAFATLVEHFHTPAPRPPVGIHPAATVHPDAVVDASASVGPGACIDNGARIGPRTVVHANAVIGPRSVLGADCIIYSNVAIREDVSLGDRVIVHCGAVLGADGFGFEFRNGRHEKIQQLGGVEIGDDVEIGANTTIDRARFGRTRIGDGTKIDNLVQIGHNVVIGRHCIIVSACAISGSTVLGDYVTMGGQVGVVGHVAIGDRAIVAAQSGISKDIPAGEIWWGSPATPMEKTKRNNAYIHRLDRLFERVKQLEDQIGSK